MAKKSSWRAGFAESETIQRIRPQYSHDFLNNPHKGTTTFQRFNGDPLYPDLGWNDRVAPIEFPQKKPRSLSNGPTYPDTSMTYCRWVWAVLEPQKGKLNTHALDGALETAAQRGQTLQMRTQPYIADEDVPAWYWETGARHDEAYYRQSGRRVPDHNDPLYLKHWGDHIRLLGERYDGHPNLESFDIAYGGSCGECGGNSTCLTARKLVDVYVDAFQLTQLVSMLGTDGCKYGAGRKDRKLGWRADCYGDLRTDGKGNVPNGLCWNHSYDAYPREVEENGVKDAWKTAPVTFETCWTVGYWHKMGWDLDWIIENGYKYHISVFMPKSVFVPEPWMPRIMEFNKRIGYRFFLHQMTLPLEAKGGQRVELTAAIDNKGIAPIYRPYKLALRFTQGKEHHVVKLHQDIRTWLPDLSFFREKFTVPAGLKAGTPAKVACAIVNDKDAPVVKLAIKPLDKDGWHPLTHMDVV